MTREYWPIINYRQKRNNRQTLLLLAGGFCLLLQACGNAPGSETKAPPVSNVKEEALLVVHPQLCRLRNELELPGELLAYRDVPIHAKVEGFISWMGVDRGSWVKKGQKMIVISCPELVQKISEADARISAANAVVTRARSAWQNEQAKLLEEEAKYDADRLTYSRLLEASRTPGAIAQNDVDLAEKTVKSDSGRVAAAQAAIAAAQAVVTAEEKNVQAAQKLRESLKAMQAYLTILAPFDGVISSRNVHEGSIVGVDAARTAPPLVRIQQLSPLRLVAAIPEDAVGNLQEGAAVNFVVPTFPGKKFTATVARPAFALDEATRTMPVELNVPNTPRELVPGMFCTLQWTVSRPYKTIFLPASAVGTDLVGSFVNQVVDGGMQRLPVKKAYTMGDLIEVVGELDENSLVALKASNELKNGKRKATQQATAQEVKTANAKSEKAGGE